MRITIPPSFDTTKLTPHTSLSLSHSPTPPTNQLNPTNPPTNTNTLTNRAIENGANLLAEGFLFTVAASLILGESFRSSRSATKRRDAVDEKIEELVRRVKGLEDRVERVEGVWEAEREREGR